MENENRKNHIRSDPDCDRPAVIFVIARFTSSTEFNAKTIQSLDDKRNNRHGTYCSIHGGIGRDHIDSGDVGTPIANKLADLSSYFLIVFSAIYLEKYLVTITRIGGDSKSLVKYM